MRPPDDVLNRLDRPGSPRRLAVLRICWCGYAAWLSAAGQFDLFRVVDPNRSMRTVLGAVTLERGSQLLDLLLPVLLVAGILGLLGLGTRYSVTATALAFGLVGAIHYQYYDAPLPWLYLWFPLLVLARSDSGAVWSLDAILSRRRPPRSGPEYTWPVELGRAWFAYIYIAAGLSKVFPLRDLLPWLTGMTTQRIVWSRYLHSFAYFLTDRPLFDYSRPSLWFVVGGLIAVVLELGVCVILFTSRFDHVVLVAILGFHGALWFLGVPGFGLEAALLGLVLLGGRTSPPAENPNEPRASGVA